MCLIFASSGTLSAVAPETAFRNFVKKDGDRLMDGDREVRFISFNIPNLHYVEDHLAFEAISAWRLPDAFEIDDALLAVKQMGGRVVRIYTLSVKRSGDAPGLPRHVTAPGAFDEESFRALDLVLQRANALGIRIIIPFVDNWKWWGGRGEYAAFRGKQPKDFWTDPEVISDFKRTIEYVITRTNSLTGVKFRDDKAILAWETGNELECPHSWTREIAGYIRSLDSNHLVLDGRHGQRLTDEMVDEPLTDIVTTHHYPDNPQESIRYIVENRVKTRGKKPYIVGEFGFVSTDAFRVFFDTIIKEGISGALAWSLRGRSRDGGFYWHSEPLGGDIYKAYHWPGFATGRVYDESALLSLMLLKAHEIQGTAIPRAEPPGPPVLLPIAHPSQIAWRGSAGATSYRIERAEANKGPWTEISAGISDAEVQYRPVFGDSSASRNRRYFYRVVAENSVGRSKPSNVVGPVEVIELASVDELANFSRSFHHRGKMSLVSQEARKAKEDIHRLRGEKDAFITYRADQAIRRCRIYTFFPGESDLVFLASSDGLAFSPLPTRKTAFASGEPEYGYWNPVLFEVGDLPPDTRFFRIVFPALADLARVEIYY